GVNDSAALPSLPDRSPLFRTGVNDSEFRVSERYVCPRSCPARKLRARTSPDTNRRRHRRFATSLAAQLRERSIDLDPTREQWRPEIAARFQSLADGPKRVIARFQLRTDLVPRDRRRHRRAIGGAQRVRRDERLGHELLVVEEEPTAALVLLVFDRDL